MSITTDYSLSTFSRSVRTLFLKTAWAPISVLIFHAIAVKTPYRVQLNFSLHSSGGASMGYLCFHALGVFAYLLGSQSKLGRYLFSFTLACTIGLFWEFGEYAIDHLRHSRIQMSLQDTMQDLMADATGATVALVMIYLASRYLSQRARVS